MLKLRSQIRSTAGENSNNMVIKMIETKNGKIAVINSDTPIITDGPSVLDFAVNIGYKYDCRNIVVNKAAIGEDFFRLSTGVAGEVVQKFVNYGYRLAIIGDFSAYTSKPLRDYMYECNNGNHLYFVADENAAIGRLSRQY